MRIALIGNFPLNPDKISGGPQAVLTYLLNGLECYPDLDLYVITAHKEVKKPFTIEKHRVKYHYLHYPNRTTFLAFPALQKTVAHKFRQINPDLIHCQSGYVFGAISLSSGYPTVLTVHDIYGKSIKYSPHRIYKINLYLQHTMMRKYFIRKAKHIVSINPYIRNHYESLTNADFYEIDNPISNAFFELDSTTEEAHRIIDVGFISALKRPDLALKAMKIARQDEPRLHLQFAGSVSDSRLAAGLADYIKKHKLDGNVKFLGQLSETEILEAYKQMSILLLPSDLETSPMVVQQAMAAGKPVIATAVGGVPNLIDHERTGILVRADDAEDIARWLVRLSRDPEKRRSIGHEARKVAFSRFRSDVVASKTYEMYKTILSKEAHP
jgi:glycosyltransferase involved in cell wall biosynthesis